jgi:hypothetical protein
MDPEYLALLQNGDFLRLAEERMEKQAIKSKKPLYQLRDKTGAPYCDILCGGCSKEASRIEEYMQFGLCRAVKYCSKKCQTHDWKHGGNALHSMGLNIHTRSCVLSLKLPTRNGTTPATVE